MNEWRFDSKDEAIVGRLIRSSGRGPTPPPGARERVYAAVHAEWRRNVAQPAVARRSERSSGFDWLGTFLKPGLAVAAAAAIAVGVGSFVFIGPDVAPVEIAALGRTVGEVNVYAPKAVAATRATAGMTLVAGTRLRTGADGGAALALETGESLRLNVATEVVLASATNLELAAGTVYLDSEPALAADPAVVVSTRYGDVRHIGTQYEVSLGDGNLRVRVREGAVAVAAGAEELVGNAGEQIVVPPGGDAVTTTFAPTDPAWQWTETLAVLPDATAYPLGDVLDWVARQTGRVVEFASADVERRAAGLELNGVAGLTPQETIEVVRSTTDLDYRMTDTSIVVD